MIIVLSPAKSLDYETPPHVKKHTIPDFVDDAAELIGGLRRLSPQQIATLMDISDPLARLNFQRYADWSEKFDTRNAKQAVLAFNGDVYEGFDAKSLSAADLPGVRDQLGHPGRTRRIRRPVADRARRELVERELDHTVVTAGRDRHPAVGPPGRGHHDLVRQGDREYDAVVVVGVLADQVDPSGRPPATVGRRTENILEGTHEPTFRKVSATSSGRVSLMNAPMPDSEPARYLILSLARRIDNTSRCR